MKVKVIQTGLKIVKLSNVNHQTDFERMELLNIWAQADVNSIFDKITHVSFCPLNVDPVAKL